jgi:hypothetical protein
MKPGFKTSEFWLSLTTVIVAPLASSGVLSGTPKAVQIIMVIGSVLTTLGYGAGRTFLKLEQPSGSPEITDEPTPVDKPSHGV